MFGLGPHACGCMPATGGRVLRPPVIDCVALSAGSRVMRRRRVAGAAGCLRGMPG
jgi:hypothetical protein